MDHTPKWHSNAFRSSFKMTKKIIVGNIFYHFLFAVSLGYRASKMSEKFRLNRKIGFQNTFYTKSINVTIDSIGPSIILRSIVYYCTIITWHKIVIDNCFCDGQSSKGNNSKSINDRVTILALCMSTHVG